MTLLLLLGAWFTLSPVLAFACGAFIKAGEGPRLEAPPPQLPDVDGPSNLRSLGARGVAG